MGIINLEAIVIYSLVGLVLFCVFILLKQLFSPHKRVDVKTKQTLEPEISKAPQDQEQVFVKISERNENIWDYKYVEVSERTVEKDSASCFSFAKLTGDRLRVIILDEILETEDDSSKYIVDHFFLDLNKHKAYRLLRK